MIIDREPYGTIAQAMKTATREEVISLVDTFGLKTKSLLHQATALLIALDQPSWLFAIDMGLGKTKLALDICTMRRRNNQMRRVLVIGPSITSFQWTKQAQQHSDLTIQVVAGNAATKRRIFETSESDLTFVTAEWITRQFSEGTKDASKSDWVRQCMQRFDGLVVDEAHRMSSASSIGLIGLVKYAAHIQYRYLLTGTPVKNRQTNVWGLYYLLDGGKTFGANYYSFLQYFFSVKEKKVGRRFSGMVRTIKLYTLKKKTFAQFVQRLWSKAIRWEETECNDLPPKKYVPVPVEMTSEQQRMYDDDKIQDNDTKKQLITAGINFKNSPKLDAVLFLVDSVVVQGERPFIVWHWLVEEGAYLHEHIKRKYPKVRLASVRGETTNQEKEKALAMWREGKPMVLVANTAALGIGIDLFEASSCVFFSNGRAAIDRLQAEKRIHRTGQNRMCTYYDVFVPGSIDENNLAVVNRARTTIREVLGDR